MVNFTILAGGYTSFIASYLFNTDTSSLTLLGQYTTGANPSWITLHPTNKSILYATNENDVGSLQSFEIASGVLSSAIDTVGSGGNGPAFTAPLSTGQVAIMNYGSGNGLVIPTTSDPLHFATNANLITFPAEVSHPHMVLQHGEEIFVPDLGADKIWRLVEDGAPGNWKIQGFIAQPTGSGPRHIVTRGNTLYTLHELSSTLTQQTIPPAPNGTSQITASFSIIPEEQPPQSDWHAGEILLSSTSPSFPAPYLYVSNRNTGPVLDPRGDTIAIFEIEPELKLVKQVYTGLNQIRGMELGGSGGVSGGGEDEFLVAASVAEDAGVAMFKRVDGGRDLELVVRNADIPTRSSFVWL